MQISCVITLFAFCASCGVVTRARYGNGLKLKIENNRFGRRDMPRQKSYASKPKPRIRIQAIATENVDTTIYLSSSEIVDQLSPDTPEEIVSVSRHSHTKAAPREIKDTSRRKTSVKKPKERNPVPFEPHAKWAAILFYGGFILPFVGWAAMIVGFVFAFIALHKINTSKTEYRGYGLALSVIVVFITMMIFAIILVSLLIALLL